MKKIYISIWFSLISVITFSQWTWQNPLPQGNTLSSVYFCSANIGYAVGDVGTILKTINGGTTWTTLPCGIPYSPPHLASVYFTDANTGYAVGSGGVILKTNDGGTIWTNLSSNTTYLYSLSG